MLKSVPVINKARNTPEVESSAEASIAKGAPRVRNSKAAQQRRATSPIQAPASSRERIAAVLVSPTVGRPRMDAGRCKSFHRLLHRLDSCAQVRPSRRAVTVTSRCRFSRRISVCPGRFRHFRQRTQSRGAAPRTVQQRIAHGLPTSCGSRPVAHANGVGHVVRDDRSRRRFAFQYRAGIEATSSAVKPARAATVGFTLNTVAGLLMVLSMPFSMSTTPWILPMASSTLGAHSFSKSRRARTV